VMAGLRTRGTVPFKDVFLTAIVCDKQGRKFSKTLGNGIDPTDIVARHGADAARFTGVYLAPLGSRIKMAPEDFEHGARFINKLWNAARFLFQFVDPQRPIRPIDEPNLDLPSQWLLHELRETSDRVNHGLATYHMNEAV